MGQHFQNVLKLLAEAKIEQAEGESSNLEDYIVELEEERELIEEMIERARGDAPRPKEQKNKLRLKRKPIPESERSDFIKKTAHEVATANSGKASTTEIAKAIEAKGIDLRTKVPGTMIGNVLFKDKPNWEWVEKGVFKYVGLPK